MNKSLVYVAIAVLIIIGVWYFVLNKPSQPSMPYQQTTTTTTQETATTSATTAETTVILSEQNKSGEMGTATFTELDGKVKVTFKMTGAPAGVTQPAHIHVGKCPDVGAVKYPLTSPVDGMSETMLDVTLAQLKSELPLGINIHKSATEAKVYVSCGDLAF